MNEKENDEFHSLETLYYYCMKIITSNNSELS